MNSSLVSPAVGFLAFFVTGVLLSAVYDVLRIWRAVFRSGKRAVFFQDFIYMILAADFTFFVDLGVCFGKLRIYLFVGEVLGWFAWHETIGRITVFLFRKFFGFLYRKVFDPAGAHLHTAASKLGKQIKKFIRSGQKRLQNRKKSLKHSPPVVYNYYNQVGKQKRYPPGRKKARRKMKVIEGKTGKRKRKRSFLLRFAVLVFSVYVLALLIQQQSAISAKKQQLSSVKQQIQIQEIKNEELKNDVGKGNSAYMEKTAREELDYSKPGERVYVNIAGK